MCKNASNRVTFVFFHVFKCHFGVDKAVYRKTFFGFLEIFEKGSKTRCGPYSCIFCTLELVRFLGRFEVCVHLVNVFAFWSHSGHLQK